MDKVKILAEEQNYIKLQEAFMQNYLLERAKGTFSWVSFATKELLQTRASEARDVLRSMKAGFDAVYDRIFLQISDTVRKPLT